MTLCGKRIDWKSQENTNGETSEEWWEQGRKLRRKDSPRRRGTGFDQPGSDVLRQQAQADTALCSLHLTGLCAWRETLRSKNQTWQLGRSRLHLWISWWTCLCSRRAQSALNDKVCFFTHPPPLLLLAPHWLCPWGVSHSWEVLMHQSTPVFLT